jgi:hypothetical protein
MSSNSANVEAVQLKVDTMTEQERLMYIQALEKYFYIPVRFDKEYMETLLDHEEEMSTEKYDTIINDSLLSDKIIRYAEEELQSKYFSE